MEDIFSCIWDDFADEHLQTKDPYYEEVQGKSQRRKAPPGCTPEEQKAWKRLQKTAWKHDRCACGCMPVDCGLGKATLITILPVIGPCMMYAVHARLVEVANKSLNKQLPEALVAKMYSNILFDFLITLPPVLGVLLGYLHACSTRNAAMIHTHLKKTARRRNELAVGASQVQQIQGAGNRFGDGTYGRTTNSNNIRAFLGGGNKQPSPNMRQETGTY